MLDACLACVLNLLDFLLRKFSRWVDVGIKTYNYNYDFLFVFFVVNHFLWGRGK
jgi:hypothetical protein